MTWARIDATHQRHPKIIEAGPWAELLDLRAICLSAELEQDGRIHEASLKQISREIPRVQLAIRRLIKVRRWSPAPDGDGWIIHGFLEAQPSRSRLEEQRAAARERQTRARAKHNGVTP